MGESFRSPDDERQEEIREFLAEVVQETRKDGTTDDLEDRLEPTGNEREDEIREFLAELIQETRKGSTTEDPANRLEPTDEEQEDTPRRILHKRSLPSHRPLPRGRGRSPHSRHGGGLVCRRRCRQFWRPAHRCRR